MSNDIQKNLRTPLTKITAPAIAAGYLVPERLPVSSTDPVNLVAIIAPEPKVPERGIHSVLFENDAPQPATNTSLPFSSSGYHVSTASKTKTKINHDG